MVDASRLAVSDIPILFVAVIAFWFVASLAATNASSLTVDALKSSSTLRSLLRLLLSGVVIVCLAIEQPRLGIRDALGAAVLGILMGVIPFGYLVMSAAREHSKRRVAWTAGVYATLVASSVFIFIARQT